VFGFARRKAARGPAVDAPLPHNWRPYVHSPYCLVLL
jgi:hypothetical protein